MTENTESSKPNKVIKETLIEYTAGENVVEPVAPMRPLPYFRPLEDYSDEELEALYRETAEEDVRIAEEGLLEYAQHLREIDRL